MSQHKSRNLIILLFCIVILIVMCFAIVNQSKEVMMQEFHKHRDAFEYIKTYFVENDVLFIQNEFDKITMSINNSEVIIPLEELDDKLFVQYVRFCFNNLNYFRIFNCSTWKEGVIQLMFKKETSKDFYYYKEIVYCADNKYPYSTGVFKDIERIDTYWFYCEEDQDPPD